MVVVSSLVQDSFTNLLVRRLDRHKLLFPVHKIFPHLSLMFLWKFLSTSALFLHVCQIFDVLPLINRDNFLVYEVILVLYCHLFSKLMIVG